MLLGPYRCATSAQGFCNRSTKPTLRNNCHGSALLRCDSLFRLDGFFYVWLRRTLHGVSSEIDQAFHAPLSPKWNLEKRDGELVDDGSRHGGDKAASKKAYEDGMARAFQACHGALTDHGRFVVVFAHKHPDAWETLVSAIIRAGFVVDGSWPIATEMPGGLRNLGRASLASSIWLVCRH